MPSVLSVLGGIQLSIKFVETEYLHGRSVSRGVIRVLVEQSGRAERMVNSGSW